MAGPDLRNTAACSSGAPIPFHAQHAAGRPPHGRPRPRDQARRRRPAAHAARGAGPTCTCSCEPGTDGALALGVAHVILEEGLHDAGFVAAHTKGFAEYRAYVRQFDPERVEGITGVPAEKIRAAARLYATTKPAALMFSAAPVVHHANGVQNSRAVFALIGLTGNFDVAGGNKPAPFSWLEIGGAGFTTRQHEFELPRSWDDLPPRVGAGRFPVWAELVDQAQAMDLPRQIRTGDPYPLRALVAFGLNHRMFPGAGPLSRGHPAAGLHLRRRPVRHRRLAVRRHRAAGLQLGGAQRGALLPGEVRDAHRAGDRAAR